MCIAKINITYLIHTVLFYVLMSSLHAQSANLSLTSVNNCADGLEVGLYAKASNFSPDDFAIGSSSIFINFNPEAVQFNNYTEVNFSSTNQNNPNWMNYEIGIDNECGLINLVLHRIDTMLPEVQLNKYVDTHIGTYDFTVIDSLLDPEIIINSNYSLINAKDNDGATGIPIGNFPKIVDYACDNCDAVSYQWIYAIDPSCSGNSAGKISFKFNDNPDPDRTHVEVSVDGGQNYNYVFEDDFLDVYYIENLQSGVYNVWMRWQGGYCPMEIASFTLEAGPEVTVVEEENCVDNGLGSIRFNILDTLPVVNSYRFSIDGGFSWSQLVSNYNTDHFIFADLPFGSYDCWVVYGDGGCPSHLAIIDLESPEFPEVNIIDNFVSCSYLEGGILELDIIDHPIYEQLELSTDGGLSYSYLLEDSINYHRLENLPSGDNHIYVRWNASTCEKYLGNRFIKGMPAYDFTIKGNHTSCFTEPTGSLLINLYTSNTNYLISYDEANTFYPANQGENTFNFYDLAPGTYPIWLKHQDYQCIESLGTIVIKEKGECPSCSDGLANGLEAYIDCGGPYCPSCETCVDNMVIYASEIKSNVTFNVENNILSKGVIKNGLTVIYNAGNQIELPSNFIVEDGAIFETNLQTCDTIP